MDENQNKLIEATTTAQRFLAPNRHGNTGEMVECPATSVWSAATSSSAAWLLASASSCLRPREKLASMAAFVLSHMGPEAAIPGHMRPEQDCSSEMRAWGSEETFPGQTCKDKTAGSCRISTAPQANHPQVGESKVGEVEGRGELPLQGYATSASTVRATAGLAELRNLRTVRPSSVPVTILAAFRSNIVMPVSSKTPQKVFNFVPKSYSVESEAVLEGVLHLAGLGQLMLPRACLSTRIRQLISQLSLAAGGFLQVPPERLILLLPHANHPARNAENFGTELQRLLLHASFALTTPVSEALTVLKHFIDGSQRAQWPKSSMAHLKHSDTPKYHYKQIDTNLKCGNLQQVMVLGTKQGYAALSEGEAVESIPVQQVARRTQKAEKGTLVCEA
ncbi:MAG: hypothetical protein FRX49_05778 [Trebouxia sp. A1-2]|nr:MAG: hypothetical protein FRX49_05778 [Trebouxia sp. A1-2]